MQPGAPLASVSPPDLVEARRWYTMAAEAGHTGAQFNIGFLLAERLDPADLDGARYGTKRPPVPVTPTGR